jgi:metal-responsive CopG/Arc/MetJ family transcriptional regulator
MARTSKVAITLPKDTLSRLERARARRSLSRSAAISEAVQEWLRAKVQSDEERRYTEAYLRVPERAADVAGVARAVVEAWEPWE